MSEKHFIIRMNGLTLGSHLFELKVDDSFFESREYSEIEGANIAVKFELIKQNSLITLNFNLEGTLSMSCDRCTKSYAIPVNASEQMFLKFGDTAEKHPENVIVLNHGETELDISQSLYEFICLALPARRVPCEEDPAFVCDRDTLKKLKSISLDKPENEPSETIWEKLKNIDFKNN